MRGGEPMASGVHDALPRARFAHVYTPSDIQEANLEDCITVILVDSVVNSGRTLLQFLSHIRKIHGTIHVVVVAGVVQRGFLGVDLKASLQGYEKLDIVALRVSDHEFVGPGVTDTGNRLFNTTHLA
ncbi:hypothetical protein LOZ66_006814 [Ophidiomyces ophidiicola]|nr:hypothetical protein LOZ66_006814 [Ophidiomyces ophidiicola]